MDEQAFGLSNIPTEEYMCIAHSIKAAETGMQCPPPPQTKNILSEHEPNHAEDSWNFILISFLRNMHMFEFLCTVHVGVWLTD